MAEFAYKQLHEQRPSKSNGVFDERYVKREWNLSSH